MEHASLQQGLIGLFSSGNMGYKIEVRQIQQTLAELWVIKNRGITEQAHLL
jgi:hypothetical protein